MGQFKPMVKMMTTEPSIELKLKKGGHVAMPKMKSKDNGTGSKKMADGGMSGVLARAGLPPGPVGGAAPAAPSMAARRKAMMGRKKADGGEALKKHAAMPASKAHKGLKTGGVAMGQGGYKDGGSVIPVSASKRGAEGYAETKMVTTTPDRSPAKTGGVKMGNAGGYKKGGKVKMAMGGPSIGPKADPQNATPYVETPEDRSERFREFERLNPSMSSRDLQRAFFWQTTPSSPPTKITYNTPKNVVDTNSPESVRQIQLQDEKNRGYARARLAQGLKVNDYHPETGRSLTSPFYGLNVPQTQTTLRNVSGPRTRPDEDMSIVSETKQIYKKGGKVKGMKSGGNVKKMADGGKSFAEKIKAMKSSFDQPSPQSMSPSRIPRPEENTGPGPRFTGGVRGSSSTAPKPIPAFMGIERKPTPIFKGAQTESPPSRSEPSRTSVAGTSYGPVRSQKKGGAAKYAKGGGVEGNVSTTPAGVSGTTTGSVRKGNAGGYKKGGAPKKFARGGSVNDSGKAEKMPQGYKKPPTPVSINRLSGTYKKGGSVKGYLEGGPADVAEEKQRKAMQKAYEDVPKHQRELEQAMNPLDMLKEAYDKAVEMFGRKPAGDSVTKTKESVTVTPLKKRYGGAC